jgi:hypothetical protein
MRAPSTDKARFAKESDLCAAFIAVAEKEGWCAYPETAGFDVLLVSCDGIQIGIEAKLSLNLKVLTQIMPHLSSWSFGGTGPHYRAILIPNYAAIGELFGLAHMLGVSILRQEVPDERGYMRARYFSLPTVRWGADDWHEWCPINLCPLPDYVPDVTAGASAPVALTLWKVKAIKLAIVLKERPVTRADFKVLQLSPSRWTDPYSGWLVATPSGYVAGERLPDFRAQHPTNYQQIKADRAKWDWTLLPAG